MSERRRCVVGHGEGWPVWGAAIATANEHRVAAVAALGARRLASGAADDVTSLVPLYLRAPAITRAAGV